MSAKTSTQHYIIGTAGHVDHGKSALVKVFTGVDPDRLPEEKTRGMTIDLGFAHMEITSPQNPSTVYALGIVDVPGHTNFINNMVSGIGSIDLALFIVAADDGWMPQSEEHLQILSYLNISKAVVALTKSDLVDEIAPVMDSIRTKLQDSPFEDAPIVPTSILSGDGIDELRLTIGQILDETPPPLDLEKPRLPIDRIFSQPGAGTIVTGTLSGGSFLKNQQVVIQPSGFCARIRGLQSHNQNLEEVLPGMRCALNLDDIDVASRKRKGVCRGDVVTLSDLGEPSTTINVQLTRHNRGEKTSSTLKHGVGVRWHHGGSHVPARVYLPTCQSVEPGESVLAQIRFHTPVYVFSGDRFILRNWSGNATLAGGCVLEPDATRKAYRDPGQLRFLHQCLHAMQDTATWIAVLLDRRKALKRKDLLKKSHVSPAEIEASVLHLLKENMAMEAGEYLIKTAWWTELAHKAGERIDEHAKAHPEQKGMPLNALRTALHEDLPASALFDALRDRLQEDGFVQAATDIRREDHQSKIPPHLESAIARIREALNRNPFEPPSRKELTPDHASKEAMKLLLDAQEVVALGFEVVMLESTFQEAKSHIAEFIHQEGPASVADLRNILGTTRRILIPLVEQLDREGMTIRQGDKRILK